jgi:GNAT superfamily N-acetyltransferase
VAGTLEIRALARTDDRSSFSCGDPALDRFFQHYAAQNQFRLHLAVTYVATVGPRILGFATVTVGTVERRDLPAAAARRRLPAYPLPVLRLARLGVERGVQGAGVGQALLRHVLRLALQQRDSVGCVGVVTDAKPAAVDFYGRLGFVPLGTVLEGTLPGGTTAMFLSIESLAGASASSERQGA